MSLNTFWEQRVKSRFQIAVSHWLIKKWAFVNLQAGVNDEFSVLSSERWSTGMPACMLPQYDNCQTMARQWSTSPPAPGSTRCQVCEEARLDFINDHGFEVYKRGHYIP